MMELYIGLMSGTSADGIDAALVDFSAATPNVIDTHYTPYSTDLREKIFALCRPGENEIERLGELDVLLGKLFAHTVHELLAKQSISADKILAIGSHGHTIRHSPKNTYPYTLQIADPNTIALNSGITTVADFRRKDMAAGGQGAPLVPAFHQYIFSDESRDRIIVNIGGIANITLLRQHTKTILGFDTGPGNGLLDAWIFKHLGKPHDDHGNWGKQGSRNEKLLQRLLADPYFQLAAPKSTGREYFNLAWLEKHLLDFDLKAIDVQASLVDLTAESIIRAVRDQLVTGEMLICGGGVHNEWLMTRLAELAGKDFSVNTTAKYGVDPNWVEAIAFAWLAKRTMERKPGNLASVTGAHQEVILGGIYYPG